MTKGTYCFGIALLIVSIALGTVVLRDHKSPVAAVHRTSAESHAPDSPDLAAAYWGDQRLSENGTVPDDAALNSYRLAKVYREEAKRMRRQEAVTWSWIGPGNIGGRMRSMIIDPAAPDRIFVGGVSGGIWRSEDGGITWTPVADEMSNLAVTCMVGMFSTDPDTFFAGTGEGGFFKQKTNTKNSPVPGAGIFRSIDGGNTWTHLRKTTGPNWTVVSDLEVSRDETILLAATGSGIYRSTDRGENWTRTYSGKTVLDVEFASDSSSTVVAGRSDGGALYSLDNGLTWATASGFAADRARVKLAWGPASGGSPKLYAAVTYSAGADGTDDDHIEIYSSTDLGKTYSLVNSGTSMATLANYTGALWVDPTNANTLVVGGQQLYRSTNGGVSFIGITGSAHFDNHIIRQHPAFDGSSNKTVYIGTDGGLFKALDIYTVGTSSAWIGLYNGLGTTQFYGIAVNDPGTLIGGTQDNGTPRYTGDMNNWGFTAGGDGGFATSDPRDSRYFYGEYQIAWVFRSSDEGASSTQIWFGITDAGDFHRTNFVAPIALDPNDSNRLLVGTVQLWRTNSAQSSTTWEVIKKATCQTDDDFGPVDPGHFEISPKCGISTIAIAPGNSDIIWVGQNNGEIYRTTNGTSTRPNWKRMDLPTMPKRWVSKIKLDPSHPGDVYVTFMGYESGNLWYNLGGEWVTPAGTPAVSATCIELAQEPGHIFLGTDIGLFESFDYGATQTLVTDLPNVPIADLTWQNTSPNPTLYAGTHGRGIYKRVVQAGE